MPTALGETIPSLVALGLRDWKQFQAAASAVIATAAIVWFFVPESPRWLIANGKYQEARDIITKAAKINKVKLTPDIFESDPENDKVTRDAGGDIQPGEVESDSWPALGSLLGTLGWRRDYEH